VIETPKGSRAEPAAPEQLSLPIYSLFIYDKNQARSRLLRIASLPFSDQLVVMKLPTPLLAKALVFGTAVFAVSTNTESCTGCQALNDIFPSKIFYPGSTVYQWENGEFWSNTELLGPACIFRPTSASDVSKAVLALSMSSSNFAVRGGGHMGIKVSAFKEAIVFGSSPPPGLKQY